jgi:hypothetical protein
VYVVKQRIVCEISRGLHGVPTPLSGRIVSHHSFRVMGFVCGEVWEYSPADLVPALEEVDLVAVSAHSQVNRIWERAISADYRRWPFHCRFALLAESCGAALAQARGVEEHYVVNCDNWFVHRDASPFSGERYGTPLS